MRRSLIHKGKREKCRDRPAGFIFGFYFTFLSLSQKEYKNNLTENYPFRDRPMRSLDGNKGYADSHSTTVENENIHRPTLARVSVYLQGAAASHRSVRRC